MCTCLLTLRWHHSRNLHTPTLPRKHSHIKSDMLNGACQICIKPTELCPFFGVSVGGKKKNVITHSLMTITIMDWLQDYTTKVVLAHICIIVLSIYVPAGSPAAISCCRELSDRRAVSTADEQQKIALHLCGCSTMCVCFSGGCSACTCT